MWLVRLDPRRDVKEKNDEFPDHCEQQSFRMTPADEHDAPEDASIKVAFGRFGHGKEKQSDFEVHVDWADMRYLLHKFIELENPEAIYLRRLIEFSRSIDADTTPSEEFWQILPQSN